MGGADPGSDGSASASEATGLVPRASRRTEISGRRLGTLGIGRGDRVVLALPDGDPGGHSPGWRQCRGAIAAPVNPRRRSRRHTAPAAVRRGRSSSLIEADTSFRDLPRREPGFQSSRSTLPGQAAIGADPDAANPPEPGPCPRLTIFRLILLTSGTTDVPRRVPAATRQRTGDMFGTGAGHGGSRRATAGSSSAPAYFVLGLARVVESLDLRRKRDRQQCRRRSCRVRGTSVTWIQPGPGCRRR